MLVLWEAGVNNELFTLIYALNMKSNITVLTPYSPTEEFSVKDIVKQGTYYGPSCVAPQQDSTVPTNTVNPQECL